MSWFTSNQPPAQTAQTNTGNLPAWWPTATPAPAPTAPPAPGQTVGQLTPTPGGGATPIDPLRDQNAISKAIDDAAKAQGRPGATPEDIAYWSQRILANGGLTQYWLDRLAHPDNGGGGGNSNDANFGTPPAPYQSNPWTGGDYTAPVFTAPTGVDEQNDPGYQFRLNQGNQALNRSAASKGTLLSGGTQKALARYNQDYASNEFQGVYNRALSTYGAQAQAGETQYQNRYAAYLGENARTLQDYLTNYNVTHTAQTDYWKRLQDLSGAGIATLN